jgi:hypothetical protein
MTRKTFLAAVTDACTFLMLPGSPAEMNKQAYYKTHVEPFMSVDRKHLLQMVAA